MCTALIGVVRAINGSFVNWHATELGEHVPLTQVWLVEQQTAPHTRCGGQQLPERQVYPEGQQGSLPQGNAFGAQSSQYAASIGGLSLVQT